ncbi:hypothetical protein ACVINY_006023 [Sinorhizobium meliloti]|nr:hypothetical protein [Sinorhizobium meliloti]
MAALVEIESGVFLSQDLLDALFIIEAGYPDLRSVRQLDIEVGLVKPSPEPTGSRGPDFGQRIGPDRRLRVVESKSDYDMPRTRSIYRSLEHRPTKNERLSRPRPAAGHDVARRPARRRVASRCFSVNRATSMPQFGILWRDIEAHAPRVLDTLDEQSRCLARVSKALFMSQTLDLWTCSTSPSPMLRVTTSTEATAAADIPLFRSKQPAVRIGHAAKIGEADTGELFQNTLDSRFRLESALTLDFGHAVFDAVICCQAGSVALSGLYPADAYASSADLPLKSSRAHFSCLGTDMD